MNFKEFLASELPDLNEAKMSVSEAKSKLDELAKKHTNDIARDDEYRKEVLEAVKVIFKQYKITGSQMAYMAVPRNHMRLTKGTYGLGWEAKPAIEKMITKLKDSGALKETSGKYQFNDDVKSAMWLLGFTTSSLPDFLITAFKADAAYDKYLRASF